MSHPRVFLEVSRHSCSARNARRGGVRDERLVPEFARRRLHEPPAGWLSMDRRWHTPRVSRVLLRRQVPVNDMAREQAEDHGIPIYRTVAEALRRAARGSRWMGWR